MPGSQNQSEPSGAVAMPWSPRPVTGEANSMTVPPVVMRPIRSIDKALPCSVNHSAPS